MALSPRLRVLAVALVAPSMLAGIRLNTSDTLVIQSDDIPAFTPAIGSQALPSAGALVTPTLILVSPSILPPQQEVSPVIVPPTQASSATVPVKIIKVIQVVNPNAMPQVNAQLCGRAMGLVSQLTLLSYQQERNKPVMTLNAAATLAAAQATAGQWPQLSGFNKAASGLPWSTPQKKDIQTAIAAARNLCNNPNRVPDPTQAPNVTWPEM